MDELGKFASVAVLAFLSLEAGVFTLRANEPTVLVVGETVRV